MHRFTTPRRVVVFTSLAVAIAAVPSAVGQADRVAVVEPAAGASAEVIAQGLVPFADGDYHWTLASLAVNQTATPVASGSPSFLLAGGPTALLVSTSSCACWRLGPGEAVFRPAGSESDVVALADGAAGLTTISIDPGPGSGGFAPGATVRDVDLVRGQLPADGSLTVHAEVSAFVHVTAGQVEMSDTTIPTGATATNDGDVTLLNDSAEPATVVIATIGPSVGESGEVAAPSDAPLSSDAGEPAPAPAPTAPPSTAAPTTTIDAAGADLDGDGLNGADEALRGTSPTDEDSDDDGLNDGFEVFTSGTNPTAADSDGDGANDGDELDAGTNPSADDTDSDGDGLTDDEELVHGTNSNDEDTDNDAYFDGNEVATGHDPLDPLDHP